MNQRRLHVAVRRLRGLVAEPPDAETSDQDLLRRFLADRDEAAFTALVRRHGPMVREVARRLLGQDADVEDAFQAIFLVLACQARSVRRRRSLSSWLYGVAYHTAQRVRRSATRRKRHEERAAARQPSDPAKEAAQREMWGALDTELSRLPERLRAPLVLCYLEGHTRDEAARLLGQSVRTLDRRLQRGRETLRRRLARRGVTLSGALLAVGLTHDLAGAALPARWATTTATLAADVLSGRRTPPAEVITITKGVLRSMLRTRIKLVIVSLLALGLLGTAASMVAFRTMAQASPAGSPRSEEAAPAKPAAEPDVYALLLIEDGDPRLLASAGDPSVYQRTQAVLLKSRSTLRAALRSDKAKPLAIVKSKADPERWLGQNVEAVFLENTGVLRVSVRDGSPEERAVLTNAIVAAYLDESVYAGQRAKQQRQAELDKALAATQRAVEEKRAVLHEMSRKTGLRSSSLTRQFHREDLALFRKELLRVQLAKIETQARLNHLRNQAKDSDEKAVFELRKGMGQLGPEIALFAEQEKLLAQQIDSLVKKEQQVAEAEAAEMEKSQSLRDAIVAEEQFNKQLASRVHAYQVELLAGPRVRILQEAEAGHKQK